MKTHFTFSELIIIVSALTVLSSMTLPTSDRAAELARKTRCSSNIRQGVAGMMMYSERNDGWVSLYRSGHLSWFEFGGMPEELGLPSGASIFPLDVRPVTFCPDVPVKNSPWPTTVCYGVPGFYHVTADDFNGVRKVELLTGVPLTLMVRHNILPDPASYVILADSTYGPLHNPGNARQVSGNQAPFFLRRDAGFSAVSARHLGQANLGFADGHVADSQDRERLLRQYHIANLASPDGLRVTKLLAD